MPHDAAAEKVEGPAEGAARRGNQPPHAEKLHEGVAQVRTQLAPSSAWNGACRVGLAPWRRPGGGVGEGNPALGNKQRQEEPQRVEEPGVGRQEIELLDPGRGCREAITCVPVWIFASTGTPSTLR